jgi:hypothetical protein
MFSDSSSSTPTPSLSPLPASHPLGVGARHVDEPNIIWWLFNAIFTYIAARDFGPLFLSRIGTIIKNAIKRALPLPDSVADDVIEEAEEFFEQPAVEKAMEDTMKDLGDAMKDFMAKQTENALKGAEKDTVS